jgi:hypothetical protein
MRTRSVITAFVSLAVLTNGANAGINMSNGLSTNGLSANGLSANGLSATTTAAVPRAPRASVDANDMQVFSVILPKRSN